MALPESNNGLFRTFSTSSTKMKQDLISTSTTTSPSNNSSSARSRLSFSVDSLLSRKQVVEHDVEHDVEENDSDSDESVDVEDTSSEIDEASHRHLSSHRLNNNNDDDDIAQRDASDESFKESPVMRHPPFLAGIVAMAAAAAAAANSTSPPTLSTSTQPSSCPPHMQPWPSPGPGFHLGLPGLRHPMFHKPGGKCCTVGYTTCIFVKKCFFVVVNTYVVATMVL